MKPRIAASFFSLFTVSVLVACGASEVAPSGPDEDARDTSSTESPTEPTETPEEDPGPPPATCKALAPSKDHLFALHTCDALGADRVCLFRQDNCDISIQCGGQKVEGSVIDGALNFGFALDGKDCTARFVDGKLVGRCDAGGGTCEIAEVEAVRGGEDCPALPEGSLRTRGCGNVSIKCTGSVQHECNVMAACSMGRISDLVVAGTVSERNGAGHFEFNGAEGWDCYVDEATNAQISSGDRERGEWRGTCVNPQGARCRESGGFHGLQLFFE